MDRLTYTSFLQLLCLAFFSCGKNHTEVQTENRIIPRDSVPGTDSVAVIAETPFKKFTVLVLPPFDAIANAGISPDIQKFLEVEIANDSSLTVIPFPLKKLMNVPYHQVFDKKYCGPILEKVPADIVIMSKLDNRNHTGNIETDDWDVSFKLYSTQTDRQQNSTIVIRHQSAEDIRKILTARRGEFVAEILKVAQARE